MCRRRGVTAPAAASAESAPAAPTACRNGPAAPPEPRCTGGGCRRCPLSTTYLRGRGWEGRRREGVSPGGRAATYPSLHHPSCLCLSTAHTHMYVDRMVMRSRGITKIPSRRVGSASSAASVSSPCVTSPNTVWPGWVGGGSGGQRGGQQGREGRTAEGRHPSHTPAPAGPPSAMPSHLCTGCSGAGAAPSMIEKLLPPELGSAGRQAGGCCAVSGAANRETAKDASPSPRPAPGCNNSKSPAPPRRTVVARHGQQAAACVLHPLVHLQRHLALGHLLQAGRWGTGRHRHSPTTRAAALHSPSRQRLQAPLSPTRCIGDMGAVPAARHISSLRHKALVHLRAAQRSGGGAVVAPRGGRGSGRPSCNP